jgi:hypothetical protein
LLDAADFVHAMFQRGGDRLVHGFGIGALDEIGLVSVTTEQMLKLRMWDAGQDRGVGDLVAVQVQHWQDGAVAHRTEEFVGMPGGRQRPGFRHAVSDHHGSDQIGIVIGRTVGVRTE